MQYLIIFTGQRIYNNLLIEDVFYKQLEKNQTSLGFSSISYYFSDLTDLVISYVFYKKDMLEQLYRSFSYKVVKLTYLDNVFTINYEIDVLFRNCVSEVKEPIYSTCFYLIEENGKFVFHHISRGLDEGEVLDNDQLNMKGAIDGQSDMFYRHFYNISYTDMQVAEITKMLLTVDAPKAAIS